LCDHFSKKRKIVAAIFVLDTAPLSWHGGERSKEEKLILYCGVMQQVLTRQDCFSQNIQGVPKKKKYILLLLISRQPLNQIARNFN
jgi:hypothetical protein